MFPLDILELYVLTVLDGKPQDCLTHCLPIIRNTTNCETSVFKKKVDSYLKTILDNPCVPNEDNSLDARINEMRWCTLRGGLDG